MIIYKIVIINALLYCFFIFNSINAKPISGDSDKKASLIIYPFDNKSKIKGIEKEISQLVRNYFFKTKRFNILEEKKIDKIFKLYELQLSGISNIDITNHIQQLVNTKYILVGSVIYANTIYNEKEETEEEEIEKEDGTKSIIYKDYLVQSWKGEVKLTGRLIDIATRKIICEKSSDGTKEYEEKTLLRKWSKEDSENINAAAKSCLQFCLTSFLVVCTKSFYRWILGIKKQRKK